MPDRVLLVSVAAGPEVLGYLRWTCRDGPVDAFLA